MNYQYRGMSQMIIQASYMDCMLLVRANEDVGRQIFLGTYEEEDLMFLLQNVRDEDVFFDVGANIGIFSIAVAKRNVSVHVHAFEPILLNNNLLNASVCMNGLSNVLSNQFCVGDHEAEVEFSVSEDSAYSSLLDTRRRVEASKITVHMVTIDDYCHRNSINHIDLMKIDVEGAEDLVLEGAKRIFSNKNTKPRLVMLELYDKNLDIYGKKIEDIFSRMAFFGYSSFIVHNGIKIPFQKVHHNVVYNVFFENT